MSPSIDLSKPNRTVHVGVILMNSVTEILDVAPIDLIHGMTKEMVEMLGFPDELKGQSLDLQFHWVNEKGGLARLTSGITMQATDSFSTCPTLDIVLMGASVDGYLPNDAELAFVRKAYEQSAAFITICGGFQVALMAGLFEGKTATAPRLLLPGLRETAPGVKWVENRWARDGKLWTSGALLNGLDVMKSFALTTFDGEKDNSLIKNLVDIGGWPVRTNDYSEISGKA